MHPQTLRQYDRLGLVSPDRTPGRGRRYSLRDIELLREVQRLSQEGVNLAGIKRLLALQQQVTRLAVRVVQLEQELAVAHTTLRRAQSSPPQSGPRTASPRGQARDVRRVDETAILPWQAPRDL
ncbi:MAG: MerR family transcriptional regulator [Streptosporangiales bacterium]|nr:MerR family transcriptional regulator [Streptosporangiales bacterium]